MGASEGADGGVREGEGGGGGEGEEVRGGGCDEGHDDEARWAPRGVLGEQVDEGL